MTEEQRTAWKVFDGSLLTVPELVPCWQWAAKNRFLPSDVTAKSGMYDVCVTPWMRESQESFDDPDVQTTVLCFASRLGKTEGLLNLTGRTITDDPKHMLVLYPTLDSGKKWSKEFFNPMVESSHCFRGLISDPKKRDGDNTMLSKRFPGGRVSVIGANSPSGFRQIQAPIIICDEIDAMENSREGDPISLAFKRAENYGDSIQVLSSTPTIKGLSRIWDWLLASDYRKYFVPSPYSENWHVLDWENMKWEEGRPETATYHDPDTGDPWTEEQRRDCVMAGEWRPTQEFVGIRGYWCDGMVSLFSPKKGYRSKYHQFASEFLDAKAKGSETLQVWHNTFRALPWEDEAEKLDWEEVRERAEDYEPAPLPDTVLLLTLAADVQGDRIEYEWAGWGDDFESWGLGYGVITGDTKRPSTWERFENEVRRPWNHPSLGKMSLTRCFVDEGFRPDMTRKFALKMLQQGIEVFPCQGVGRAGVIEPELLQFNPKRKQKGIVAPTWNVGVNRAKRTIYGHMLADPPGPNTMHWPRGYGYDDRYFQMLTAERVVTRYSYGKAYKQFVNDPGTRNEALDIRVYGYAAAVSLNPDWDVLREKRIRKPKTVDLEIETVEEESELTSEEQGGRRSSRASSRRRDASGPSFVNNY